jgi:hypothetical protein
MRDSMLYFSRLHPRDASRFRGASPRAAFVHGFWLASPRATRGQGHHPEFCRLSRGSGTSSGRLAPYDSASRALSVNTRYAAIGWVVNGRAHGPDRICGGPPARFNKEKRRALASISMRGARLCLQHVLTNARAYSPSTSSTRRCG